MKRFQSYLFGFSLQGCDGIKARTLYTLSTHSTPDLHSNPTSTFLIISMAFPLIAFYPLYFCLVSANLITNLLGEGHVHQFKSHSLKNAMLSTHIQRVSQWSFQIHRPQLNLHGVHCICSLCKASQLLVSYSLSPPSENKLSGSRICLGFCFSWHRLKV